MEIGELISQKRKEKKLTLEEVGNLVGVGKSTVRKWEKGMIENIGRDNIVKLSKALDISPLSLLGIVEENDHPPSELIPLDKKLGIWVKNYREKKDISQETLAKILDISVNDINAYENGIKPFSVAMVFNFAIALNIRFDDLFPEDVKYDKIPAIIKIKNEHNCIITADGKKYTLSDKEMNKVRDLLIFKNRK